MRSLLSELKRRRVLQTAAVYVAVAWGATEMLGFLLPALNFPRWTVTIVAILFVVGFPVAMLLAWVFDVNEDGIRRTSPGSTRGRLTIGVAFAFLIVSTTGLFYLIYPSGTETQLVAEKAAFNPPDNSIAVLPFVNMSDDPDNLYFSDGVSEELLHRLARDPGLWVTSRTSSFKYRDNSVDVRTIGEELNVAKILEGSVRKDGDRVRVTVQLINARDGYHDWSETFDRELKDILAVQEEIASAVGDELLLQMAVVRRSGNLTLADVGTPDEAGIATRGIDDKGERWPSTFDPDLYDAYLRARQQIVRGTDEQKAAAAEALKEVVEERPRFARAWLTLAEYYVQRGSVDPAFDDMALAAIEHALRADSNQGAAYALKGRVHDRRWQWMEAEQAFQRALSLSPSIALSTGSYGIFLARVGHSGRAVELLKFAVQRDAESSEYRAGLAVALAATGDPEAAVHAADSQTLLEAGSLSPASAAIYHAVLGDLDSAYAASWSALADRSFELQLLWIPSLAAFRRHTAFNKLAGRTGLLRHWSTHGAPDSCALVDQQIHCD